MKGIYHGLSVLVLLACATPQKERLQNVSNQGVQSVHPPNQAPPLREVQGQTLSEQFPSQRDCDYIMGSFREECENEPAVNRFRFFAPGESPR